MADFQQYLAILDSDPVDDRVLDAIEAALAADGAADAPEARDALDQARRSLHDRGELDVVARLFDMEIAATGDAGRQADLLTEKGHLCAGDLLDDEGAVACFRQVMSLRPDDETARDALDQMDMERENWRKFVQKNLDEAQASTDRALTTHMYLSAAQYYGRFEPAAPELEAYLQKALEVDPRNHKAALLLERLLRKAERWSDLLAMLEQRAEAAGREARVQALLAMAEVARAHLDDAAVAEISMKKVLAMDPAHPRAMRMLADIYEEAEDWSALVMLYTGALKARRRGDESELGMLLQIAMLHWRRLDNMDAAEEYFRRIRKAEPAHPAALEFYRVYYPARGEGSKLLQVLRQAQNGLPANREEHAPRRRALSVEMADLAENELGNPEKAIDAWKSILRAEPDAEDAREALKRLYRKTEKWNALLDMMKDDIDRLAEDEVDARVTGLMEVVGIYRDRLKLDVMVINTYNSILKLDPHNRRALEELAEKYEQLGRWNDLITVLSRKAEMPEVPVPERAAILREIARLWSERFGNLAQAIRPLEQLIELAPDDAEAVAQLKDIYTRRRQWRSLIELLQREVAWREPEDRRDGLVETARLAVERLGDNKLSTELWNRVLELPGHAGDMDALAALAHLYDREKRYLALAEVYRRQRALAPDEATAANVLEKLGSLLADRLQAPAQAAEAFQELLALRPDHARAVRTLRELYAAAGDYESLERVYADLGQWDDLVEAFHNIADRIEDRDARLALLERTAMIAAEHFADKPDKIARAYERVLSVVPDHALAARALVPVYEVTQKWARLLSSYEILLGHAEDDAARLDLHVKIRDLCENQLGSKALAFQWTAQAYRLAPARPDLLADLQRLGAEADQWEVVAEILDARVRAEDVGEDEALGLLRELGRITAVRLHQPERARGYQRQVLALVPDDPAAMDALEELATQLSDWPDLLSVYRRRVELVDDELDRVDLLFKIAFIEEERVAALDDAAATYQSILALQPDSHRATRALAKIQEARGDWAGLVEVLGRELAQSEDTDARVLLLMRMGGLQEHNLGRVRDALGSYRSALALAPGRSQIHAALERFLDGGGAPGTIADSAPHTALDISERVEVAELLLPIYERSEDPRRLARAMEVLRAGAEARESAGDRSGRDALSCDRRLRVLYGERMDDAARAYEAGLRVLAREPADADNRTALMRYAQDLGKDKDLAGHLNQALEASEGRADPAARRALAMELASLYQVRLEDPAQAEHAWLAVLDLPAAGPESDAAAYDALDGIYRAAGRWQDLRDLLLRREASTLASNERKQIVLAICELEEGVLDNADGAITAYQRVLDIDPGLGRAYRALERLYGQAERFVELEDLLGRELEHTDRADARIDLSYRRAELRARRLDDPHGAVALLEDLVEERPAHAQARALLEALLPQDDLRLHIARVLEPLYERDRSWADLCRILRVQQEFAASRHESAALLSRVAEVQENEMGLPGGVPALGEQGLAPDTARGPGEDAGEDADAGAEDDAGEGMGAEATADDRPAATPSPGAFATWVEILDVLPSDERARLALRRLGAAQARWPEVAAAYERALDAVDPTDLLLRAELLAELAEIYDVHFEGNERAISAYRRLLDLDPSNPDTVRVASTALDRLYESEKRWRELIEIVRRQADWAESVDARKLMLARVARIDEEELGDADAAIATWREVLAEEPEDTVALSALERLYQAGDRAAELVEILRRRVEMAADASERKVHLGRIAVLAENQLADPSEAILAHLEVLDHVPDDGDTLIELSRLYRLQERYADLLDIIERRLALTGDEAEHVALTCEVGHLMHRHLGREAEALERYADVLALDAGHAEALTAIESMVDDAHLLMRAAEILRPIYAEAGARGSTEAHRKLAELLLRVADASLDPREQLRSLTAAARLREQHLDDRAGAFAVAVRALRLGVAEPELPELVSEVERLGAELGRQGDIIEIYREIVPDVLDGALQRRLQLDIADLARAVHGDLAMARDYYRRVLDAVPDDRRAMSALEDIYRQEGEHEALYDILVRKAELSASDMDRQAEALAEAARLCTDELDRPEDAILAWEQVLEIAPENKAAVEALEALYEEGERFHDLVDLLERRLGYAFAVEEAVALRYRLGELHEHKLHDPEGAVDNYSAALGGDPDHGGAGEALERFLDDPGSRNAAAEVLEPIYVSRLDWDKLVRIYEIKLESSVDDDERRVLTRYIARLYEEQLEDLRGASRWYGRVFRESPWDAGVRDQLARLAVILDGWGDLANIYQEYLDDETGDSPEVAVVARTLGDIYNDRLNEVERALGAYRRVLQVKPDDLDTFARLEGMLSRAERWYALIEVYEEAIATTTDEARRKELHARMARVHENHLHDAEQAINAYREVLIMGAGEAGDAAAVAELERLYQQESMWFELSELLSDRIVRATSASASTTGDAPGMGAAAPGTTDDVVSLRLRLAEVLETRLERTADAIDQYELVLAADAGWQKALPPLERLVVNEDHRERIAEMLEPVYRANDWWQKLVVILDTQVPYVDDPARRVAMLREIAQLHERRGGDPSLALAALSRAWRENVHDSEVEGELSALAAKLGAWDALVATLEQGIEGEYDQDLVVSILARVAGIHESSRGDVASAIAAWRRVLEVKDDDAEALSALDRLLAGEGQYEALVAVVLRRAELAEDDAARLALLHRVAAIHEDELAQPLEAVAAYKNVLLVDDRDVRALDALERLYRKEQDWNELVGVLARKIDLSEGAAMRRELRFAAASIYDEKLSDAFEAIALYRAVIDAEDEPAGDAAALGSAAADGEALRKLDTLYQREAMWPELLEILDRRIALEADAAERAELAYRAARVVETEMLELDAAVDRYAALLAYAPTHAGARAALDAMTEREESLERAAQVLEMLYRKEQDFTALAALYERRLAAPALDPALRLSQYQTLARVSEELQGDVDGAFDVWARALVEFPDSEDVLAQLERLAAARGAWEDLVALLEERLAEILDTQLEYAYATKLARLYEDALGDLEGAAAQYRRALEVAQDEREPLAALDRIYGHAGRPQELAQVLAREAEATLDVPEQCQFLFRLGDLREVALVDVPGAVVAYRDVLERLPQHPAARAALERLLSTAEEVRADIIRILEPLYEEEGAHTRLADLLTAKLGTTRDHFDRAQIYSRVAELAEHQLGDPVRALDAAGGWLAEDPRSEQALAELARLAGAVDRWSEMAARLSGIIDTADADDVKRLLLVRLGTVQLDRLHDAAAAEASFQRCLALDPDAVDALQALQRIYTERGRERGHKRGREHDDQTALAGVLGRLAELTFDADAKRAYLVEMAELRAALGETGAAVAAWRDVLALDEGDREALGKLAGIYEQAADWPALVEVLAQASRFAADVAEERALRTRIARIHADTLGDTAAAVDAWQAVLDVAPDAADALEALEALHTRREDWLAVQDVLVRRLDLAASAAAAGPDGAAAQVQVLSRLAALAEERRESVDDAIGYLFQVLELDGAHLDTYATLERLLSKAERWHDLVELLERLAGVHGRQGGGRPEIDALARAAEVWEGPLENPAAAGEILEKILQREPAYVPALTRLAKIYEREGDWLRCSEVLERALALGPSGRDAAELYFRMGEVVRQRDGGTDEAMAQAMGHWQRALEADGGYMPAVQAVEAAARESDRWELVADMVARREAAATAPEDKLALVLELSELYGKRLAQPERVIPLLERAAALSPEDPRVEEPLAELYAVAGRHGDAVPMYERLAEAAKKARNMKAVASYRQRLGGIYEAQGDAERALGAYEEAFRVNPTDVATMAGLGRLYRAREDWEKARRVYRSMVLQNIDPSMGISKAEVYLHLGEIHLKLNEPRKAKGMFQRGLELEPQNPQLLAALEAMG